MRVLFYFAEGNADAEYGVAPEWGAGSYQLVVPERWVALTFPSITTYKVDHLVEDPPAYEDLLGNTIDFAFTGSRLLSLIVETNSLAWLVSRWPAGAAVRTLLVLVEARINGGWNGDLYYRVDIGAYLHDVATVASA